MDMEVNKENGDGHRHGHRYGLGDGQGHVMDIEMIQYGMSLINGLKSTPGRQSLEFLNFYVPRSCIPVEILLL